jgi:hypothetical protein
MKHSMACIPHEEKPEDSHRHGKNRAATGFYVRFLRSAGVIDIMVSKALIQNGNGEIH